MTTTTEEVAADQQDEADFASAFDLAPPTATAAGENVMDGAPQPVVADLVPPPTEQSAEPAAPAQDDVVPIKRSELADLKAGLEKALGYQQQLDKLNGSTGSLKQAIERLKAETPAGQGVEITDEDFAELIEAMPEVGKLTRAALQKVLARANVRGTARPAEIDPVAIRQLAFDAIIHRERQQLDESYPDWLEVVGSSAEPTEFQNWLATKPAEYQHRVRTSTYPRDMERALDGFTAWKSAQTPRQAAATPPPSVSTAPAPKAAARRAVIESAIQPRGDGRQPPPAKTDQDHFESAWR